MSKTIKLNTSHLEHLIKQYKNYIKECYKKLNDEKTIKELKEVNYYLQNHTKDTIQFNSLIQYDLIDIYINTILINIAEKKVNCSYRQLLKLTERIILISYPNLATTGRI